MHIYVAYTNSSVKKTHKKGVFASSTNTAEGTRGLVHSVLNVHTLVWE